jgi:hypothetical protein
MVLSLPLQLGFPGQSYKTFFFVANAPDKLECLFLVSFLAFQIKLEPA